MFAVNRSKVVEVTQGNVMICEAVIPEHDEHGHKYNEAEVQACALKYARYVIGSSGSQPLIATVR